MFRNEYNLWCCSRTTRSHPKRKSTNVLQSIVITKQLIIVPFYFYFQIFALSQLHATRAVSGRSVPIITCLATSACAFIRYYGPGSMGGRGDFRANIDAEDAITNGLSEDDISRKVRISYHILLDELSDFVSKDITSHRRETHSNTWPSCNVWLWIFPAEA